MSASRCRERSRKHASSCFPASRGCPRTFQLSFPSLFYPLLSSSASSSSFLPLAFSLIPMPVSILFPLSPRPCSSHACFSCFSFLCVCLPSVPLQTPLLPSLLSFRRDERQFLLETRQKLFMFNYLLFVSLLCGDEGAWSSSAKAASSSPGNVLLRGRGVLCRCSHCDRPPSGEG